MKNRMCLAEGNGRFYKLVKFRIALLLVPVQPCDLIVLTIRIVIAGLGIAKFITRQKGRPGKGKCWSFAKNR